MVVTPKALESEAALFTKSTADGTDELFDGVHTNESKALQLANVVSVIDDDSTLNLTVKSILFEATVLGLEKQWLGRPFD